MRRSDTGEKGAGRGPVMRRSACKGPDDDRGSVSAEAAVVIPALVLFTMALVWALTAAAAQIQCVDAARIGARAAARSEPRAAALAAARSAAPRGARVTVGRAGELWRVRVEAPTPGPGPLTLTLNAEAAALDEGEVSGPSDSDVPSGPNGPNGPNGPSGPSGPSGPGNAGTANGETRAPPDGSAVRA